MDGGALVTLAEQWSNVPPQRICSAKEDNKQRHVLHTNKCRHLNKI